MPYLEVIKSGLMTSIQDRGRKGWMHYAIPRSGAMDQASAQLALEILDKERNEAVIECTSIAPQFLFHHAAQIAITGADFDWTLNGEQIALNKAIAIEAGAMLKGKAAKNGLRGYIAIQGKLLVEKVYHSYATYHNAQIGGYKGRFLKAGDVLEWEKQERKLKTTSFTKQLPISNLIPIQKGPEFDYLSQEAQQFLLTTTYKVGADSNRMGMRLQGTSLAASSYQLPYSLPILPGFMQLPPSGQPIIILQDGQISGGYPRIAYVPEQFLVGLNQVPLGGAIQFDLI